MRGLLLPPLLTVAAAEDLTTSPDLYRAVQLGGLPFLPCPVIPPYIHEFSSGGKSSGRSSLHTLDAYGQQQRRNESGLFPKHVVISSIASRPES
ncbi:hypothetical protein JEQ12_010192 [Ovis aries]|uniref:Secreted protein n=1 Tax=Ovis aries TaxID=9940 RepID=A0A836ACI3_SHEEP|nr:hypothetical protein JEQ12_010192 [Ovis aries]